MDVKKQVMYLDRWVDREHFRAFVYKSGGDKKLARSYEEFELLISSGLWFDSIDSIPKEPLKQIRKSKHDSCISAS
ncbi:MAG TPA: hypothetical protein VNX68_08860 [Nitrosopumilaceae archaeon]|nr:hypothetical protein [Nitrosopumilaceae archaeon]